MTPRANAAMSPDDALTPRQAATLLALSVAGPRRPVDDLIERLRRPDGATWMAQALDAFSEQTIGVAAEDVLAGRVAPNDLVAAKEAAKARLADAKTIDDALGATLCYFAAAGAALAHHGEVISSRSRSDLQDVLIDLAAAAPPAWAELFEVAAEG